MSQRRQWSVHLELYTEGPADEFDQIVDAYYDLEQSDAALLDSAWSLTRSDAASLVEVDLTIAGTDEDEVWAKASTAIRTAVHAGGGGTPSWTERISELRHAYLITEKRDVTLLDA